MGGYMDESKFDVCHFLIFGILSDDVAISAFGFSFVYVDLWYSLGRSR